MTPDQLAEARDLYQRGEPIPDSLSPWEGGESAYWEHHLAEVEWAVSHGEMDLARRLMSRPHWTETWYRTVGHDRPYEVTKQPIGLAAPEPGEDELDPYLAALREVRLAVEHRSQDPDMVALAAPETAGAPVDAPVPTPSPQLTSEAYNWGHTLRGNPAHRAHLMGRYIEWQREQTRR